MSSFLFTKLLTHQRWRLPVGNT